MISPTGQRRDATDADSAPITWSDGSPAVTDQDAAPLDHRIVALIVRTWRRGPRESETSTSSVLCVERYHGRGKIRSNSVFLSRRYAVLSKSGMLCSESFA